MLLLELLLDIKMLHQHSASALGAFLKQLCQKRVM